MVFSTVGFAAAANYPRPFVNNGVADVAVVYGSHPSAQSDMAAVTNIVGNLNSAVLSGSLTSGGAATPQGGDFVKLERASSKFHLGKGIRDVVSGTLTDDDLEVLLADGEFRDEQSNNHEYSQKISLGNLTLGLFEESDYKPDTPTLGFNIPTNAHILNYTLEFSSYPAWADLETQELTIMGKPYFILKTVTNKTIELLDSAVTATVYPGDIKKITVGGKNYDVSTNVISQNGVIFSVNGQTTKRLKVGETDKLSDGSYIGVKDFQHASFAGDTAFAEFTIGSGKIELRGDSEVRVNNQNVNGLKAYFENSNEKLSKITLSWTSNDKMFITEDSQITMPAIGGVQFSFTGMTFPKEETFTLKDGGKTSFQLNSFPLKDGNFNIDFLYGNGTHFQGIGKESGRGLQSARGLGATFVYNGTGGTNSYFVLTYDDGTNAESYVVSADGFTESNNQNVTDIRYYKSGGWTERKNAAKEGDTITLGSASFTINKIDRLARTINITLGNYNYADRLYSKEGLFVQLPWLNATETVISTCPTLATAEGQLNIVYNTSTNTYCRPDTYTLTFKEEDRNENKGSGNTFTALLNWNSNEVRVSSVSGSSPSGGLEIGDSDKYLSYVYGPLATKLMHDRGKDMRPLEITYYGGESYGNAFVTAPDVTIGTGSDGSISLAISDTEIASASSKNLIVVGGSCVNTVAAELLRGQGAQRFCGADWTAATGLGANQFLIQTFARTGGKVATLVAGWESMDTANAATALTTQTVDTTVGKKYRGSTASSIESVMA